MDDLISRAAVLNGISDLMKSPWYNDGKDGERHVQYLARKDAVEVVKVLCVVKEPAVDAVPVVHGYWVEEPDRQRHWHCSNCGKVQGITCVVMKYCPECGARMAEHPWAASGCGQAFSPD